jgi:hypothetical protein
MRTPLDDTFGCRPIGTHASRGGDPRHAFLYGRPMLAPGHPAPRFRVRDEREQEVEAASLWAGAPAVLVFLRHFG